MFETTITDGVLGLHWPGTRWLSTGWDGGFERAEGAYNVTVPEGWERTDLGAYIDERRDRAGFTAGGPTLLTGVEMRHARGARLDPVVAYATVGLSNPAALPIEPTGTGEERFDGPSGVGTVNLLVGTTRCLNKAALATLLGVVVEAKTATLLAESGFSGTTTDAVVVGSDERGGAGDVRRERDAGRCCRSCVRPRGGTSEFPLTIRRARGSPFGRGRRTWGRHRPTCRGVHAVNGRTPLRRRTDCRA